MGIELLINVTAMLILFIALVHLANAALGLLPEIVATMDQPVSELSPR